MPPLTTTRAKAKAARREANRAQHARLQAEYHAQRARTREARSNGLAITDAVLMEVARQHVGCIPMHVTCCALGLTARTYRAVLHRMADHIAALHAEADRMAVLYPLLFGLTHAPGTAHERLGHREMLAAACRASASPSAAAAMQVERGSRRSAGSAQAVLDAGLAEAPARRDRKAKPCPDEAAPCPVAHDVCGDPPAGGIDRGGGE